MAQSNSCRRYRRIIEHRPAKAVLRTTEHRWTPLKKRCLSSEEREKEEIVSKFQTILNKLTHQNFECLAEQARNLDISTEERLQICINKVFLMVQLVSNKAKIYAYFCHTIFCIKEKVVVVNEKETTIYAWFRREIHSRCHREFEKQEQAALMKAIEEATSEEDKEIKKNELIEWEIKSHKRSLASSQFFAQLFKLKLLSESAMHDYIQYIVHLVCSTFDEEALKSFCHLIKTIGKELDDSQTKQCMDQYFECIAGVFDKKKISFHIRFMFQDILELRKNKWEHEKKTDQYMLLTEQEDILPIEHGLVSSGQDDVGGQRESVPNVTRITALVRNHKKKEHAVPILGPGCNLCPRWKRPQTLIPPPDPDLKTEKKSKQKMLLASQLTGLSGSIEFELDTTQLINPSPQPFVQNDISDDEAQSNSSDVPVIPGQQYEEFQVKNDDCDVVHSFTLQQEMQTTLHTNFQQASTSPQQQPHRESTPQASQQQIHSPEVTSSAQHREGTPQAPQQVYTAEVPQQREGTSQAPQQVYTAEVPQQREGTSQAPQQVYTAEVPQQREGTPQVSQQVHTAEVPQQREDTPQAPQQLEVTLSPHGEGIPQVFQQVYAPEVPTNSQHRDRSLQSSQQLHSPEVLASPQQLTLRDHIPQPTPNTEESPRVPNTHWQQAHIPQRFANPPITWQNDHPESMHFQIQQPVYSHQQSYGWDHPQVPIHTQQPEYVPPQYYGQNNYYQTHSHYLLPQPHAQDPAVYNSNPSLFSFQMLSSPQSHFYMNTFQPNPTLCPPQSYMIVHAPCTPLLHISNGPTPHQQAQYMNTDLGPPHQQFYPSASPSIPPHQTYMSASCLPLLHSHVPHQQPQYMNTNTAFPQQQFAFHNHSPPQPHVSAPHPPLFSNNIGPPLQQRPINPLSRQQAQYRPRKTNPVPLHQQSLLLANDCAPSCRQSRQNHSDLTNIEDNLVCVLLSKELFDDIQLSYLGPEQYQPTDQPLCQPGQVVDKQDSGNALIVRYPSNKVVLILHAATVTKVKHAKKDRVMVVNSKDLVYKYHGTNATRFCGKLGTVEEVSVRGVVVSIDNRNISFNPFCLMPVSDNAICIICVENLRDVVMDCCSQQVMCSECLDKLDKPECPFCRCPIQQRTELC